MKYKILKDFPGSQDGTKSEWFHAGTVVDLSDYLVSCVDKSWIKAVEVDNKAVITDGRRRNKNAL
jgi:hypothetical protein